MKPRQWTAEDLGYDGWFIYYKDDNGIAHYPKKEIDLKLVEKQEYDKLLQVARNMREALIWAEDFFRRRDEMNSNVHCAPLRLSPITSRVILAAETFDLLQEGSK